MSQQNESNQMKVEVVKVLFYKQESMWGIVSVKPKGDKNTYKPQLNMWGSFVIRGTIPFELTVGKEYDIDISDLKNDPKYGEYHEIVRIHMEQLNSVESQQRFLQAILTEAQAGAIIEAYPNSMLLDDINNGVINLLSIKGIGEATAKRIREKIEKNKDLGALMVELADLNPTGRMLSNIIKQFQGSATVALAKAKESLYNLCSVSGISFKRVDEVALARGEDKFGAKRIRAYAEHYFDEIANQGHSWVDEREFLVKSIEELDINGSYIRGYLQSEDGREKFYWQEESKRISSMRMYNNEKNTLQNLLRLASTYQIPTEVNVDEAIRSAEINLGLSYTDEQKETIKVAILHGVFILNGQGGTGKTTVVKGITEVLEYINRTYQACALSGKASQVLLSKGIESATIHRTFGIGLSGVSEQINSGFTRDVVIVDETSMVNAELFSIVLKKLPSGSMVVLVGDSGQLSGIGHGDVLRDLLQTKYFKSVELMQIHRQAQDSGIIEVASKIRKGQQIVSANFTGKEVHGVNKDMIILGYKEKDSMPADIKKILTGQAKNIKNKQDLMDFQVVVAMKERGDLSAKSINILAQSIFNDLDKPHVTHGGYDYRDGDKVIVKGNSYEIQYYIDLEHYHSVQDRGMSEEEINFHLDMMESREEKEAFLDSIPKSRTGDLFNGTMGIIIEIFDGWDNKSKKATKFIAIEFEGLGIMIFQQSELDILELAYAVTCHRLQGSTIKNIVVLLDYSAFSLLSRQWVYTAITRASKKCVLMVQSSALVKAIATDSSGNRQTFLGDMIRGIQKNGGNLEETITIINKKLEEDRKKEENEKTLEEEVFSED